MEGIVQILGWFHKGGLVMYPLLVCSIIAVSIAIERFRCYGYACGRKRVLLAMVEGQIDAEAWSEAILTCRTYGGMVGRVLAAGLVHRAQIAVMRQSFEEMTCVEATNLRKNLGYLDTIVTMAPLLGLLGTVVGMIGSFQVLDVAGQNPAAITGGVGEALIATASGLCVALIALAIHSYFSHRLDSLITDVETICALAVRKARGACE